MMMRGQSKAAMLAGVAMLMLAGQAFAQADTRGLADRLDRLERDLSLVQSQMYRSGGSAAAPAAPAAGGGGALSADAYSRFEDRISGLEQQLREVTGQVERANYLNSQLSAKVDRMQADNDIRFKELETGRGGAAAAGSAGGPAGGGNGAGAAAAGSGGAAGFLNPADAGRGPSTAQPPVPGVKPPAAKTPAEQFEQAFSLLRNNDYDNGGREMQAFIDRNPNDPQTGNALYWVGRVSYIQGHYDQAARQFYDSYKRFPKAQKAPESLLGVGLSMSALNKKKEACAVFQTFKEQYPDASDVLKKQSASERQRLGCP